MKKGEKYSRIKGQIQQVNIQLISMLIYREKWGEETFEVLMPRIFNGYGHAIRTQKEIIKHFNFQGNKASCRCRKPYCLIPETPPHII